MKLKNPETLVEYLNNNARSELDNEAAATLRKLWSVYEAAYEMVWAKTHEHSKAAYVDMINLVKRGEVDALRKQT
jgi:hypothetical protein